jgi:hypothetical protein
LITNTITIIISINNCPIPPVISNSLQHPPTNLPRIITSIKNASTTNRIFEFRILHNILVRKKPGHNHLSLPIYFFLKKTFRVVKVDRI